MSRQNLSRHHKKCSSNGGTSEPRNVIYIKEKHHRAWHTLFQNKTAEEIAKIINTIYLDPDFKFVVTPIKMRGG